MVKRCLKLLTLAYVMTHATSATAAAAVPDTELVWANDAIRVLTARPEANDLATAAALRFVMKSSASPTALQLLGQAAELAPQSAAIGWLHLQICAASAGCDSRDVATVLRWVDPDNSAAWMSALSAAHKDKDAIELDRTLADMAHGTRFDLYYNQIVVLMFDALASVRRELPESVAASDSTRLATVTGIANAEIIPPLTPLVDICREAAAGGERHEDCLKIAKIMQRGDTILVQMVGFAIEKRLIAADSKEGRALAEKRRLLEWRSAAADNLGAPLLPWSKNTRARERLAQMRLRPREEDVCIALLRSHRLALEPAEAHQ